MRHLSLRPHLSTEQLKTRMLEQKQVRLHTYWQILNAVASSPGKKAQEIADVLGTTPTIVRRIVQTYNTKGADFDKTLQWGGRRQALSLMSVQQETAVMKQLQSKALKGAVLTFRDIKETVEKKLSREVSDDYIWDLFKRHGWSKKAPRPKHPSENVQAQQQFKKLPRLLASCFRGVKDKRPIKLFFEDEARFGRINNVSRCWCTTRQQSGGGSANGKGVHLRLHGRMSGDGRELFYHSSCNQHASDECIFESIE